ncbi:MAG: PAS domain S-box protein, partial [Blastocatellia bacterium]|nr:PAS domain S-box protein [Blastocatellia bacterium]
PRARGKQHGRSLAHRTRRHDDLHRPSTNRILGYESREMIGRNIFEFVHPEDAEEARNMFIEMIREPSRTVLALLRLRHSDGSWRWIEHVSKNLISESSVQAIVANYRDVTERK